MPQRNDSSRSTPTTSPKNNSWFRMQAGHQSDADIYIYDEIGFWGVTAKQFISDLNALGDITHIISISIHRVAMSLKASPFLMR